MASLLLTGFEPFLNNPINPTQDIVQALDNQTIGEFQVVGRILPVDFNQAAVQLLEYYKETDPDAVVLLGLAAGRRCITPERIAINCNDGARDNTGFTPEDEPIAAEGPAGYFSKLPIRAIVNQLKEAGLPAEISNTAGTYLCNNVMYTMLHHLSQTNRDIPAGFIHVPASHELAIQASMPSWSTADLIRAMKIAIETI